MGIWTRKKPLGAVAVMPGSYSPFPACVSLRRLPEVRTNQTLPSLSTLFFHLSKASTADGERESPFEEKG